MPTAPKLHPAISYPSNNHYEFLLPNGLLIPLDQIDEELNLYDVKSELWQTAAKQPLFHLLQPPDRYILVGIHRETAEEEEYYDENMRLGELSLLFRCLRVIEVTRDSRLLEQSKRDAIISSCIGIAHADLEQADLIPEFRWARSGLKKLASLHAQALHESGSIGLAQYLTSAIKRDQSVAFKQLVNSLPCLLISAWMWSGNDAVREELVQCSLPIQATVRDALINLLQKQTELALRHSPELRQLSPELLKPPDVEAYVLKVCCSQSYLFDFSSQLIMYDYVQKCVQQSQKPCLSPVLREDLCNTLTASLPTSDGTVDCTTMDHTPRYSSQISSRPRSTSSTRQLTDNDYSPYHAVDSWFRHELEDFEASPNYRHSDNLTTNDESIWNLTGYFSVYVHRSKFSVGAGRSTTPSANLAPNQQAQTVALPTPIPTLPASSIRAVWEFANSSYFVRVGLFHGSQSLIEYQTTEVRPDLKMTWNKWLNFHIYWADIPPATRLCAALINVKKRSNKTEEYPVGWANVNLFDHRGYMISGDISLHLWPASLLQSTEERFNGLYPAGTVLKNPTPNFTLHIQLRPPTQKQVRMPAYRSYLVAFAQNQSTFESKPRLSSKKSRKFSLYRLNGIKRQVAVINQGGDIEGDLEGDDYVDDMNTDTPPLLQTDYNSFDLCDDLDSSDMCGQQMTQENSDPEIIDPILHGLVQRDPLYEMSEQEKSALWQSRAVCIKQIPGLLPWFTQIVSWHQRTSVMEFYHILKQLPRPINPQIALHLLGAMGLSSTSGVSSSIGIPSPMQIGMHVKTYTGTSSSSGGGGGASGVADPNVRYLAVVSLYKLSDGELSDYLLQLVQALKAEAYLDNPLSRFLLYRALQNPTQIGLRFFWHLRSEIHLPDMRLKFGLLLEAFCVGCGQLLTLLSHQVSALNRLENISCRLKQLSNEEEQRALFREHLIRPETRRDLQWLPSPLSLSVNLGSLAIDKCDVKRSKKRPLWLVWTNSDNLAAHHHKHHQLIFKHGDDLRQDMLTLQLLRVMDRIWKDEGMDMCLLPYDCIATGPEMGLIEAVRNARTVMSIQKERLRAALQIDKTQLYRWLTQPTGGDSRLSYNQIMHNFTQSCAGYCVATFVLGIRDRHPDNIMVDTSGRLFHIDFGHILDNRKKKFGITRERVPFVLTRDFITVINRGNVDAGASEHFQKFTELCGKAYLLLRRHSNLILTLLAMMLPSGLPELSSACDLDYVRKTLAVELDDDEAALAYFNAQLNEAYHGAWTTRIDWIGHWMNT